MSKKLVAAALATLSLTACEPSPKPAAVAVISSKVVPLPVLPPRVEGRDAGRPASVVPEEAAPVDGLVVAHQTPDVDHLGRSRLLALEGDVGGALLEARRALFTLPADVETLRLVGQLARKAGQPQLAAEAWGRVARLVPEDATPVVQQARALLQLKDLAGAVLAGREAVSRDPGLAEAHHVTGLAQLAMQELGGALASFQQAVALDGDHGWAHNNLGFAALRANQNELAVGALTRAAELLPHVAVVHNNLGVALERTGQPDGAKVAYQRAMDLSPRYVKARLNAERVAKAPTATEVEGAAVPLSVEVHPLEE